MSQHYEDSTCVVYASHMETIQMVYKYLYISWFIMYVFQTLSCFIEFLNEIVNWNQEYFKLLFWNWQKKKWSVATLRGIGMCWVWCSRNNINNDTNFIQVMADVHNYLVGTIPTKCYYRNTTDLTWTKCIIHL